MIYRNLKLTKHPELLDQVLKHKKAAVTTEPELEEKPEPEVKPEPKVKARAVAPATLPSTPARTDAEVPKKAAPKLKASAKLLDFCNAMRYDPTEYLAELEAKGFTQDQVDSQVIGRPTPKPRSIYDRT
jgi:hypothetical protein